MSEKLNNAILQLTKQAKDLGESEFTSLVEFYSDLAQEEDDLDVFIASCSQFAAGAEYLKSTFKALKRLQEKAKRSHSAAPT